jgi:hypothetical protein
MASAGSTIIDELIASVWDADGRVTGLAQSP